MELLLIRHGDKQRGTGVLYDPDGALTDNGMHQVCVTSAWLNYYFNLHNAKGFVSPYMRTLQTASVLSEVADIEFEVNSLIREHRLPRQEALQIANRSLLFQNLQWPVKEWTGKSCFFAEETIEDFVDRIVQFREFLQKREVAKAVVVGHCAPLVVLAELEIGRDPAEIKKRVHEAAQLANQPSPMAGMALDKYVYLNGIKECGLTWIKDGKANWFSKTVYDGNTQ